VLVAALVVLLAVSVTVASPSVVLIVGCVASLFAKVLHAALCVG
jgi:hypothetical protein